MKLLLIRPEQAGRLTLSVLGEGEKPASLTVTEEEYTSLSLPTPPAELDDEVAERLLALDEGHRARRAAARILEFGDNNGKTLARKLILRGFSATAAEDAALYMEKKGYLREEDLLVRSARASFKKLWGPKKIAAALTAKGFERREVEACILRLLDTEFDIEEQKRLLLLKKGGGLDAMKKRALLYRYGYGQE